MEEQKQVLIILAKFPTSTTNNSVLKQNNNISIMILEYYVFFFKLEIVIIEHSIMVDIDLRLGYNLNISGMINKQVRFLFKKKIITSD